MGWVNGLLNSLKNMSYIIDSKPEMFEMDEDAVRSAWEHLLEVKDNGGGITEEEACLILDWAVQKTRVVLDDMLRQQGSSIEKDSLLAQNENISIFYYKEKSFNCSIYFRPHVEDPNYEDHINYYVSTIGRDFDYESKYNNHSTEYAGKLSYFNLIYYHDEPAESTESKESIEPTEKSKNIFLIYAPSIYQKY